MPPTVSLQGNPNAGGNPYIEDVGSRNGDAVIIASGFTSGSLGANGGGVQYQIRRQDRGVMAMDGLTELNVYASNATSELVRAVSQSSLTIILPFRTDFQVRTRQGSGTWTSWTSFKTRDKTYAIPDAAFNEVTVTEAANSTGSTVTVTGIGKATEATSATGTQVTNTDTGANDVSAIASSSTGARVTARAVETVTSTGVRITNT